MLTRYRETLRDNVRVAPIVIGAVVALFLLTSDRAGAANAVVVVSGVNNAMLTVSIADSTADMGSNLDPNGTDSNSVDVVFDFQGGTGNQGSQYLWTHQGTGNVVEVSSNKAWFGTIGATENAGTSQTMTVESGVLKYVEGPEPASYEDCDAGTGLTTSPATWKASIGPGRSVFVHYYCLRVDWDDAPGTFTSSITYTATQS